MILLAAAQQGAPLTDVVSMRRGPMRPERGIAAPGGKLLASLLSRRVVAGAVLLGALVLHGHHVDSVVAQQAVVHGVLVYDLNCGSCAVVLDEVLPSVEARYGEQLDLVKVDAATVDGFRIWTAGTKAYQVPNEKKGVPLVFLGDRALSGRDEISAQLVDAIEAGIAAGGVPLPPFVTFTEAERARWATHSSSPVAPEPKADPTAYGLAFVVLAGTVLGLLFVALGLWKSRPLAVRALSEHARLERSKLIPPLVVAGLLVAGYLSHLRLSRSDAICPIGNCDAVQHSAWANLFGVPVAYLGFLTYGALLGLWLWGRLGRGASARLASVLILGIAAFGTAFSAYLTVLELFVIHAVCMWCLLSAVVMTLILVAAAYPLHRPGRAPSPCPSRAARAEASPSGAGSGGP